MTERERLQRALALTCEAHDTLVSSNDENANALGYFCQLDEAVDFLHLAKERISTCIDRAAQVPT